MTVRLRQETPPPAKRGNGDLIQVQTIYEEVRDLAELGGGEGKEFRLWAGQAAKRMLGSTPDRGLSAHIVLAHSVREGARGRDLRLIYSN